VPVVGARSAGQQPQLVGEPPGETVEAERRQAGGGQLDRQREAVELPADLGDSATLRRVHRPAHRRGPVQEQGDRIRPTAVLGERERRDHEGPLERDHQPGSAGGQHAQARAAGEQALDERGHPVAEVLAVVQHQQRMAVRQRGHHRLVQAAALLLPDPKGRGHRGPTIAGSVIGTRSTNHTPSANSPAASAATASASRVFPTPPGPTAVTWRCAVTASASAARSRTRPTNGVNGDGSAAGT
jgi:hypothetical protein